MSDETRPAQAPTARWRQPRDNTTRQYDTPVRPNDTPSGEQRATKLDSASYEIAVKKREALIVEHGAAWNAAIYSSWKGETINDRSSPGGNQNNNARQPHPARGADHFLMGWFVEVAATRSPSKN